MNLGKAIKLCRTQKGMNAKDLAGKLGVSNGYISFIETGQRLPSYTMLLGIANALNIPLPLLIFLASDEHELNGIDHRLREKLSGLSIRLLSKVSV